MSRRLPKDIAPIWLNGPVDCGRFIGLSLCITIGGVLRRNAVVMRRPIKPASVYNARRRLKQWAFRMLRKAKADG